MSRRALLLAGLAVVALCGCGDDWKGQGEVVDHSYDDPDYHPMLYIPGSTQCYTVGKTTQCYTSPPIILPAHTDGERWLLKLQDDSGKTHTVSVPKETYDECADGSTYDTETKTC